MKSMKRRTFLAHSTAAAASILGLTSRSYSGIANEQPVVGKLDSAQKSRQPNRIAVSTYSFWRFKKGLKLPIETCIDEAAEMGFDG
ncbi:unnamed protein product, partial [marine sediment metagenome]